MFSALVERQAERFGPVEGQHAKAEPEPPPPPPGYENVDMGRLFAERMAMKKLKANAARN